MKSSLITRVLTTTGFVLGAFALAAVAGTWTPAPANPPDNNVDAPINVGLSEQIKLGPIRVNTSLPVAAPVGLIVGGKIQMLNGPLGAGKVLTDVLGNGVGTWETPTGGGGAPAVIPEGSITMAYPASFTNYTSGWITAAYDLPAGKKIHSVTLLYSGTSNPYLTSIDEFSFAKSDITVNAARDQFKITYKDTSKPPAGLGTYPGSSLTVYVSISYY